VKNLNVYAPFILIFLCGVFFIYSYAKNISINWIMVGAIGTVVINWSVIFLLSPKNDTTGFVRNGSSPFGNTKSQYVYIVSLFCMVLTDTEGMYFKDYIGSVIAIAGVSLCIWSHFHLGREGHKLIQSGPYGIVRHPIYSGLLLLPIACNVFNGLNSLTLFGILGKAVLIYYLVLAYNKINAEEDLLSKKFGEDWKKFAFHTPQKLIPMIY